MTLFFDNGYVLKPIAEVSTSREMFRHIHQFCTSRSYTIHYSRHWSNENEDGSYTLVVDVGSHSQFFKVIFSDKAAVDNFMV